MESPEKSRVRRRPIPGARTAALALPALLTFITLVALLPRPSPGRNAGAAARSHAAPGSDSLRAPADAAPGQDPAGGADAPTAAPSPADANDAPLQDPAGDAVSADQEPAAAPPPQVADTICRMCHGEVETPHSRGEAAAGAVHSGVACVECHASLAELDLDEMEHEADPPPASCAGCHASVQQRMDQSAHAEMEMTCAQCHGSHQVRPVHAADAPVAAARVNALCSRCHADIASAEPGDIHVLALSGRTCLACHDPHAAAPPAELAGDGTCLACHDGSEPDGAGAPPSAIAGSVHGAAGIGCVLCHVELRDNEQYPHGEVGDVRCAACHAGAAEAHARGVHATVLASGEQAARCQDCHGTHDVATVADPRSRVFPLRLPDTCESCHRPDPPPEHPAPAGESVGQYETSAHGVALRRSGLVVTATCRSCHGSHEIHHIEDPESPTSRGKVPYTCGACHVGILQGYLAGVHGTDFLGGGADVPVCTDCHGEHTIAGPESPASAVSPERVAQTCARCHADEDLAEKHGIAPARMASFGRSYHGVASALGEGGAANCASCHGFHDILPSSDPRSLIHPDNLEETCGKCHAGYGAAFARVPVHSVIDRESNFIPWIVGVVYTVLIAATIGAFVLFILIDLFGRMRIRLGWGPPETEHVEPERWPDEDRLVAPGETFRRMTRQARLQHGLLIASFTLLVLTGLPLFLHQIPLMRSLVGLEGGFRLRSDLHRTAAIGLIGLSLWHLAGLLIDPRARRWVRGMMIRPRDVTDFFREAMFSLGLAAWLSRRRPFRAFFARHPGLRFDRRPPLGRYGLVEKLEYIAVVWGNLVMIATGFVLWRPDWFLARLPVWVFEVSRVTHGYEATLAFLAIVVWHMYHVHMRPGVFPMSRVWLHGRMSRSELKHHHPAEYVAILEGRRQQLARGAAGEVMQGESSSG